MNLFGVRIVPGLLALAAFTLRTVAAPFDRSAFETAIHQEMQEWGITGAAVAVVDDQEIVYSERFGEARPSGAFRCGSISKLFAAVSVMP